MRIDIDFAAIEQRARRERAEAVYRLLLRPLANLFRHPAPAARTVATVLHRASA